MVRKGQNGVARGIWLELFGKQLEWREHKSHPGCDAGLVRRIVSTEPGNSVHASQLSIAFECNPAVRAERCAASTHSAGHHSITKHPRRRSADAVYSKLQ